MGIFVAALTVMFLLPSVVMLVIGASLHRKGSTRGRAEVPAYVVEFSNFRRPYAVVFDYQLPNGQWNRMKKHVSHMTIDSSVGSVASALYIKPGHRFSVYVSRSNPFDVSMGALSYRAVIPVVLMIAGSMGTVLALGLVASVL